VNEESLLSVAGSRKDTVGYTPLSLLEIHESMSVKRGAMLKLKKAVNMVLLTDM